MNKIISAKNLTKSFENGGVKQTIINDLDLDIYENDFTVIMGSSGAGKSTLMYSLSGMDSPTSGVVIFNGKDITKMNPDKLAVFRRKNCGFVFQQVYMLDKMSLLDNVLVAGLLINNNKKEVIENAKELFRKVNLSENTIRKSVNKVSGGEAACKPGRNHRHLLHQKSHRGIERPYQQRASYSRRDLHIPQICL